MKWRSQPQAPDPRAAERRIDLEAEAELDRCGALKDFWYVACLSTELKEKQVLSRTILGTPLAVFRGADGKPAALFDRCASRTARHCEHSTASTVEEQRRAHSAVHNTHKEAGCTVLHA